MFALQNSYFILSVLLLFVVISQAQYQQANINNNHVLKCWRCSTDVSNGEFCNDPFDPAYISDQQRYWSYVNCTYSVGVKSVNARPVCKKLVQEVYGKRVISRSCFYEDIDDPSDRCSRDSSSSYLKTIYCETCSTDGCNTATGFAPYAALMLFTTLLLNFFK